MKRKWKAGMLLVTAIAIVIVIAGVSKVSVKATSVTEINLDDASKIPDAALRAHLKESTYDQNGDGILSAEEIQNIDELVLYNCGTDCKGISDFTGIEYLTELKRFNIAFASNVTSIDLSRNTQLTEVNVNSAENLSSLTLGEQNNLVVLYASDTALQTVDVRHCPKLYYLTISGDNFTSLDVAGNTVLRILSLNYCAKLRSLNVTGCSGLTNLACSGSALSSLELTGCVNLEYLTAEGNYSTQEDNHFALKNISDCTKLKTLDLSYSGIEELDVSKFIDLESLRVKGCKLKKLDCSGLTKLNSLNVGGLDANPVTFSELKLDGCTNLRTLILSNLQISTLNLSSFSMLSGLDLSAMNCLEALDVSGTPLTSLFLSNMSQLKTLTARNMTKLTEFSLSNALLTTLDMSGCPELTYVSLNNCKSMKEISLTNNTKLTSIYLYDNAIEELDVTNNEALTSLSCCYNQIKSLDVSNNLALKYLQCYDNQLKTLTLPNNGALEKLDCHNNQLETLDFSTCPKLKSLNADCNKLQTIDLSKNEELEEVKVSYNQLVTVDTVPSTSNLRTFYCYNNKITKLDLTENTRLKRFMASDNCLPALDLSQQQYVSTTSYYKDIDIVEKQVYTAIPEEIDGSKYLLRIKKDTNSDFDSTKVSQISVSDVELTEDGFVFGNITDIPIKFTYRYETNLNGKSYPMTVTVINPNSSSSVRIKYRNTSIFNRENPNPWKYTMGNGPITLKPVEKEGAKFSKWVLWNYRGNPKDLPAVTQLSDDVITDALVSNDDEYVTLRAVFEPDVVEIEYDREVKEDGSIGFINDDTFRSNNPSYVEFGKTIVLKDATRDGYTFEGWYTNPKFTIDSKVTEFCEEDEIYFTTRILYAKWRKNTSAGDNGATKPGDNTSAGDNGATKPGDNTSTGDNGATKPGDNTSTGNQNVAVPAAKGKKLTVKNKKCQVKVTSSNKGNPTVAYTKLTDKNVKKVTIPDTVTVDGITYKVTSIADSAFKSNSKITRVTIGKNVTAIGKESFKNCKNLTTVAIGKNVKTIGNNAFYGCKKLKSVTVTAGKLKTIGKNAFKGIVKKAIFKVNGTTKLKTALKKKLKSKTIGYVKTWIIK